MPMPASEIERLIKARYGISIGCQQFDRQGVAHKASKPRSHLLVVLSIDLHGDRLS